jgi:hypothetical protein
MFNTYHSGNSTQSVQINAVTGAILKNHPKSWFERFHLKSPRAQELLVEGGHCGTKMEYNSNGHSYNVHNPEKDITVLQMVVCGDMEVMAELVYTKDYEANDDNN